MELKENGTYIFKEKRNNSSLPYKGKVLEITNKTIYIMNVDTRKTFRRLLFDFKRDNEIIEEIEETLWPYAGGDIDLI